jgi:hypothetical protein
MKISAFIILLHLALPFVIFAQSDTASNWTYRLGFQSSTVPVTDFSATDSTRLQLYLAPQFSFAHKSGLGVIFRTYFLTGNNPKSNFLTTITPNYEKDTRTLYTAINYTHFFYGKNTNIPYTPIINEIYGNIRLKNKVLQPLFVFNTGWGKDSSATTVFDVNILAGLAHEFILETGKNSSMSLLPAVILNAGTNNYFSLLTGSPYIGNSKNYHSIIHSQGHKTGNAHGSGNGGSTTTSKNPLELSQLETNLYIYYSIGDISIEPDASVFFPLQSGGTVSGYFQLTANYNF